VSLKALVIVGSGVAIGSLVAFVYRTLSSPSNSSMSEAAAGGDAPVPSEDVAGAEKKILVLGLDGAGKSSLLLALSKNDYDVAPTPTAGFNVISVQTNGTALNIWEIGGSDNTRKYWSNFYADSDMLVFVVDSSAPHRMEEARTALHTVLQDDAIRQLPLLIVVNKQDQASATSALEVVTLLELDSLAIQYQLVCTQVPLNAESSGIEELEKLLISSQV